MNVAFDKGFITEMHKILVTEQQRLLSLLSKTQTHMHRQEPVSADFAEQAVEVENANENEHAVVAALDQGAQIELSQINKAIERINNGHYGECVVCGDQVNSERLKAIPFTPFCIDCASAK